MLAAYPLIAEPKPALPARQGDMAEEIRYDRLPIQKAPRSNANFLLGTLPI
jgi:hypothetical protein